MSYRHRSTAGRKVRDAARRFDEAMAQPNEDISAGEASRQKAVRFAAAGTMTGTGIGRRLEGLDRQGADGRAGSDGSEGNAGGRKQEMEDEGRRTADVEDEGGRRDETGIFRTDCAMDLVVEAVPVSSLQTSIPAAASSFVGGESGLEYAGSKLLCLSEDPKVFADDAVQDYPSDGEISREPSPASIDAVSPAMIDEDQFQTEQDDDLNLVPPKPESVQKTSDEKTSDGTDSIASSFAPPGALHPIEKHFPPGESLAAETQGNRREKYCVPMPKISQPHQDAIDNNEERVVILKERCAVAIVPFVPLLLRSHT